MALFQVSTAPNSVSTNAVTVGVFAVQSVGGGAQSVIAVQAQVQVAVGIRECFGWPLYELAEVIEIGCHYSTLVHWLRGQVRARSGRKQHQSYEKRLLPADAH